MFFRGDHDAVSPLRAPGWDIQRLDGMNVDDARFDGVLLFQKPGRRASLREPWGPQAMMATFSCSFL